MSEVRYLQSGDRYVGYRVQGDGPVDLLLCDEITMVSIDSTPDEPHRRHFDERLASFCRLITFDRAGIGLSDPPPPGVPPPRGDARPSRIGAYACRGKLRGLSASRGGGGP
jgi:hypothetical protein